MKIPNEIPAVEYTTDELQEAMRPIGSLLGKSEKALRKLTPGSWQHSMLRDNINALRIAAALLNREDVAAAGFERDDLDEAVRAFASMTGRTEKALAKSSPATSQHTLLRNRLRALCIAHALAQAELDKR